MLILFWPMDGLPFFSHARAISITRFYFPICILLLIYSSLTLHNLDTLQLRLGRCCLCKFCCVVSPLSYWPYSAQLSGIADVLYVFFQCSLSMAYCSFYLFFLSCLICYLLFTCKLFGPTYLIIFVADLDDSSVYFWIFWVAIIITHFVSIQPF